MGVRISIITNPDLAQKFDKAGYAVMSMRCRAIPYMANDTGDVEPVIAVNKQRGFSLTGKLMIDLECTPRDDPDKTNYQHVFTLVSTRFDVAGKAKIEENLVISVRDLELDANIDKIEKSTIGDVDVGTQKLLIQLFEPAVVALTRGFLNVVKIPLGFLIADLFGIAWFNFDKTVL